VKVKVYFICWIVFSGLHLYCQKWYSNLGFGYNFGLAQQNITSTVKIGSNQTSYEVTKGSFGKCAGLSIGVGYFIRKEMAVEMDLSYLKGAQISGGLYRDTISNQNLTISANMLRLSPSLRFNINSENKISYFAKIGGVVRIAGSVMSQTTNDDLQNKTTIIIEYKYSKGLSIGASAGVGITYRMTNKIFFFVEAYLIAQSWGPKNGDVTKYSINGVDQLSVLDVGQKNIHFEDNYVLDNTKQSTSVPSQQLRQYYNFSSFGAKIGLQIKFGRKDQ
jgi:hypothetical protein